MGFGFLGGVGGPTLNVSSFWSIVVPASHEAKTVLHKFSRSGPTYKTITTKCGMYISLSARPEILRHFERIKKRSSSPPRLNRLRGPSSLIACVFRGLFHLG
jgi:hypothetical protein